MTVQAVGQKGLQPPVAHLLYARAETASRVAATLAAHHIELTAVSSEPEPIDVMNDHVDILLIENLSEGESLFAQVRSFASQLPNALVIVIVSYNREIAEKALRAAGAVDVVDTGADMERQLERSIAVALRLCALKEQQRTLSAALAHRERLNSLGVLAASVGHEINNPCAVVMVNAASMRADLEVLLSRPRSQMVEALQERASDWEEALGDMLAACRRITSIVSTLGVFSREAPLNGPEPVQINEAVTAVLRFIGKEVRHQAEIELELAPDLPPVIAGQHFIMQVLTNLIMNALQALALSPAGARHLRVRTSADQSCVLLEVADNGPGIPPDIMGHVFDPFFTTKLGVGTGLGLSITRELVLRAGGDIFVESEVGKGTSFRVILPAHRVTEAPARPRSVPPQADWLRVMIVDDDEMMLRSIARSFRDRFECIPVRSVEAARKSLLRDDRIDVLVADVVMPGQTGLDLYEELLRDRPHLAARTIFFSGGVGSQALRAALEKTGRPILRKPLDFERFLETLRHVATQVSP
jgi:signal transduction histidine kinase/ActR/RegA family two-component response regulator